jgi:hypothetical protein
MPTVSISRPSKIFPNYRFWYKNTHHLATLFFVATGLSPIRQASVHTVKMVPGEDCPMLSTNVLTEENHEGGSIFFLAEFRANGTLSEKNRQFSIMH